MHTRSSGRRYRFDYEEQDHVELLALLKAAALPGDPLRLPRGPV